MKRLNLTIGRVMSVMLRALDQIDVRLVDHGHRVAYIVYKMMQASGAYSLREMQELVIVSSLHDIGAYKTEEINNMLRFESDDVFDHSIYGYLFMKYMSPLSNWAEVILYHHFNDNHYEKVNAEKRIRDIAVMIHLADRMDILMQSSQSLQQAMDDLDHQEYRFGRDAISLFKKANKQIDLGECIKNGSYLGELKEMLKHADFSGETMMKFIHMIAYSIDFRSETTVTHVVSTVSISLELGRLMGLEEEDLEKIELGAYLHDIGKIATPLEILEKPGGLTQEEMRIMREHIEITGDILKGRVQDEIYQVAYRHHEKLDGRGYPLKLKADQLTMNDRIVAVSDMMSALAGKRSYKESFSKEVVIDILQRQMDSGKLDQSVIETAISNYDFIMECCRINTLRITEIYHKIKSEFKVIKMEMLGLI
ncbi:HD domain-containing protein [Anoxybacterium hadale]|uniref:HD domain-containing protein n=1 Tax=Anoxybacterium hadale TaxID=3408580 RepID=A0ACD1AAU7_9FIRM|nr:HD domain-containing protein [Clostridiales bacterium]